MAGTKLISRYSLGWKYCSECEEWFEPNECALMVFCDDCGTQLRSDARNKSDRIFLERYAVFRH